MSDKLSNKFAQPSTLGGTVSTVLEWGVGGAAVEMTHVNVICGRVPVLRDIDLTIAQGESVALMGANGAGKSTLLKCLGGAVRPRAGHVRWFGSSDARSPFVRRQIGFVGHEEGLYAELSSLENLVFAGQIHAVRRAVERARELLAASGLELQADRLVRQLSQGMRRRLAIARAIIHEPLLILLDEPFVSLDAEGCRWLAGLFQQWRKAGRTICFASHSTSHSQVLADRMIWLEAGRNISDERTFCHLSTQLPRCA